MCVYLFTRDGQAQGTKFSVRAQREMEQPAERSPAVCGCVWKVWFRFFCSSYLRDLQNPSSPAFSQRITICYTIQPTETTCPQMTQQVMVFNTGNLAFTEKYVTWILKRLSSIKKKDLELILTIYGHSWEVRTVGNSLRSTFPGCGSFLHHWPVDNVNKQQNSHWGLAFPLGSSCFSGDGKSNARKHPGTWKAEMKCLHI